jgi:hypothetical protein
MSTPWDEVRSEAQEATAQGRRPRPLPWVLLAVALGALVAVLVVGRGKLAEERERTAAALQADDELVERIHALEAEVEHLRRTGTEPDPALGALKRQVVALEAEKQQLQAQLRSRRR